MKLIIAIIHERNKQKLSEALFAEGISYTKLGSTGGFLRQGNATLLIAVEDAQVETVLSLVRSGCKASERFVPVSAEPGIAQSQYGPNMGSVVRDASGGGVAFVVNIEEFYRF